MEILSSDIGKKLKLLFPALIDWLPTDKTFLTIEPDQVLELVNKYYDPRYIPNLWECEEISMAFVVDVRRGRLNSLEHIPVKLRKNLAIGEALGTKWEGVRKFHQANIFISSNSIFLLDMQTRKIWKASKNFDDIFFVRM